MFLRASGDVPLRSPHWGRCQTYPYQIQNVFLKDYSRLTSLPTKTQIGHWGYGVGVSRRYQTAGNIQSTA
jgi:hypothetical protein